MAALETLLLRREDVAALLDLDACIAAVEQAFADQAEGRAAGPALLSVYVPGGGYHAKAAAVGGYFAAKINANFFGNAERFGRANIQGLIVLCETESGFPVAVMDSIEITIARTAAATAVAAKRLARRGACTLAICGCGNQGRVHLRALARVCALERAFCWDVDPRRSQRLATEMSAELEMPVSAAPDPATAIAEADICVTCTPAKRWFLGRDSVPPGAFIAAVGADSPEKQELDPALLAAAAVVTDSTDQCAELGELHHAIAAGLMTRDAVRGELAEIIAGRKPGRASSSEIVVFDSTGSALQDVAAAALVYELGRTVGRGTSFRF